MKIIGRVGNDPFAEFTIEEIDAAFRMAELAMISPCVGLVGTSLPQNELAFSGLVEQYATAHAVYAEANTADPEETARAYVAAIEEMAKSTTAGALDSRIIERLFDGKDIAFTAEDIRRAMAVKLVWRSDLRADSEEETISGCELANAKLIAGDEEFIAEHFDGVWFEDEASREINLDVDQVLAAWMKLESLIDAADMLGEGVAFTWA